MSKLYILESVQKIPAPGEKVWDFFSSPANLRNITPAYMGFDIVPGADISRMYPGMIIAYRVSPLLGIKMNWITEITHVTGQSYFVDEQRFGPYAFWHHKHFFRPIEGGTEMIDIVHYKLPLPLGGKLVNSLLVRPKLEQIFRYRHKKVEEIFGSYPPQNV
jgi:ligand-binding SRPBCC domain-containing protein